LISEQEKLKIKQFTKVCNKYLKRIAEVLGTDKNLSTYFARHSFANVLKNKGVPVQLISEALEHRDIRTTDTYLSSFSDEQLFENSKKLIEF